MTRHPLLATLVLVATAVSPLPLEANHSVGLGPIALVPGRTNTLTTDLNGDGFVDLAFTLPASNRVITLLGASNGMFGTRREFTTGSTPGELAIGDVNGDGKRDLVVANTGATTLSVLHGNGDGSFAPTSIVTLVGLARSVALGDLDHDGILDLVVGTETPLGIARLLGNGNGTFGPALTIHTPTARPADLQLIDLNVDGSLDVLGIVLAEQVVTILGDGTGGFLPPTAMTLPFSFAYGAPTSFHWRVIPAEPLRILRRSSGNHEMWIHSPNPEIYTGIWQPTDRSSCYLGQTDNSGGFAFLFRWFNGATQPDTPPIFRPFDLLNPGESGALILGYAAGGAAVYEPNLFQNVNLSTPTPTIDVTAADMNGDRLSDAIVIGNDGNAYVFLNGGLTEGYRVPFGEPLAFSVMSSAGPGGTITPSGTLLTGNGGTRTFTIAPNPGFRILDVQVDGASIGRVPNWTIGNITADHTIAATFDATTGVDPAKGVLDLAPVRPTPSQGEALIRYELPRGAVARLELFDAGGRHVRSLVSGWIPAGAHEAHWRGEGDNGRSVSPGLYLVRLRVEDQELIQRIVWSR